jgi:transcriptional regulator with XRE-family HTH domain
MGKRKRFALRALRAELGKTQTEIACAAAMAQGEVSRLESRRDVKLSTLGRYASALGGVVEVAVVVGKRRYQLDLDVTQPNTETIAAMREAEGST